MHSPASAARVSWQVARTLTFFQWRDLVEALRRYRAGSPDVDDATTVWYADGHLEHPVYYRCKGAGLHVTFTVAEAEEAVSRR